MYLTVGINSTAGNIGVLVCNWRRTTFRTILVKPPGGWQSVFETSSNVKSDASSSLTDGNVTTNRSTDGITDGAGSFIAGRQDEGEFGGTIANYQLTADNFTEHVLALVLVSADLADADFLDFR